MNPKLIRKIMTERNIKAEMLAVISSCSISTIYNVLAGKPCNAKTKRAIENALKINSAFRKVQTRRKAA